MDHNLTWLVNMNSASAPKDFEDALGKLNADYFFREFTFSSNTFNPEPTKKLELADKVVWLDDIVIISNVKRRTASCGSQTRRGGLLSRLIW